MRMRKSLPAHGRSKESVLDELRALKRDDADWKHGKVPLYVFKANDEVDAVGRAAFNEYFSENALGGKRAFPSVRKMEEDVVEMALSLFRAPDGARGFMTTGGSESIIQAVLTCRDWTRRRKKSSGGRANIVAPYSAHPAFDKAARLMDIEVRRVPVGKDLRADAAAMAKRIDDATIMLVGSAPAFPYGVIDPISELGALAEQSGVWLHVDGCVGGYLAPFVRMNGGDIPDFDLSVPGVSSLSADLHKFGFCPKPASTVFYASEDKADCHPFDFDTWPNGRFVTGTITGTRPAGGVAGAWAVFQHLGIEGYREIARRLMAFVGEYRAGIERIPGLKVLGSPHLSIVAYGSDELDIYRVAERMAENGWIPGLVREPKAIHRMMSMLHADALGPYLADLRTAVGEVRKEAPAASALKASY